MAQDFRNTLTRVIGTGDTGILTAGNYDAVIGIRCCNVLTSTIKIDVKIAKGGADYFLAKGVVIPPNSAIELIQGGAKIVLASGDVLEAVSDTASSLDVVCHTSIPLVRRRNYDGNNKWNPIYWRAV